MCKCQAVLYFRLLNTVKIKNMARFAIQFFIGFAAITFIYYFSVLLDAAWILSLYSGAMLLVFIVRIAKKERKRSAQEYVQGVLKKFYNADTLLFVSMAAIFITSFICTQGTYPSFDYAEYVYLYPDNVWHMGIANSAAQGFPIEKPWYFSDSPLNYHYFCDLLYGIAQRALNIPADVAILSGTPYLITFLYTTSAYGCIKELTSGRKYLTGIFPVLSIFGVFLYTLSNYSNYFFHVLKNVNSVGVAVSLLMCIIIVIKYALKERDKRNLRYS